MSFSKQQHMIKLWITVLLNRNYRGAIPRYSVAEFGQTAIVPRYAI